jgi:hypothetical protein
MVLEDKYVCITLVSVYKSTTSKIPSHSFVENTTTGTTYDDVTKEPILVEKKELTRDEEAMVKRMEDIIQFFMDLLQVMGWELAPEK